MRTLTWRNTTRLIAPACVMLAALVSQPGVACIPLPGASGPPCVKTGKLNVFGLDELPPWMRKDARVAIERQATAVTTDQNDERVDDDDWEWPAPPEGLYPDHASMNQGRLIIQPRDVSRTELGTYRFLGLEDDTANPGEPVMTVTRQFERPDGVILSLTENALQGSGAAVMVRELIHDWVGPWPAVFTVQRAPSGRVRSVLDWTDDGTDFTLMVLDDVRRPRGAAAYDKAWLFRLAQEIEDGAGTHGR